MHRFIRALMIAVLMSSAVARADAPVPDMQAIAPLDVARYMGRWYEIAKFPNRFQKQCMGDTTAEYQLQPDRRLRVVNRCRKADGTFDEAVGVARQAGEAGAAKLKVRFAPAWLSFLPLVWGDYWVVDLDPDYQLAAVSEPGRDYLWILSRTPRVDPQRYQALLQRLQAMALDTSKLELTVQSAAPR